MQILIDINSTKTSSKTGTSKAGKAYEIVNQRGHLLQVDRITGETTPVAIDISLEPGSFPYQHLLNIRCDIRNKYCETAQFGLQLWS